MRIQHNIMAMNAYRNYTNNVSAMKKNLERLSSGYKINRAGDDAAGLAISEKMRAQITGLETAQKNAKDGISLVQTAEGALTEVHDMLNRMVELATQSANGTYDNTTDRWQMQKEVNQLLSEIDRIADSSNFNGINLLDGSLGLNKDAFELATVNAAEAGEVTGIVGDPPAAVTTANAVTKLHTEGTTGVVGNFTVYLGQANVGAVSGAKSQIKVTVGGKALTLSGTANSTAFTASQIADQMIVKGKYFCVNANGVASFASDTAAAKTAAGKGGLIYAGATAGNNVTYTLTKYMKTAGTSATATVGSLTAANVGSKAFINLNLDVAISKVDDNHGAVTYNPANVGTNATNSVMKKDGQMASTKMDFDVTKLEEGMTISINGIKKTVSLDKNNTTADINLSAYVGTDGKIKNDADTKEKAMDKIATAFKGAVTGVDVGVTDDGKLTLSENAAATAATKKKMETVAGFKGMVSVTKPEVKAGSTVKVKDAAAINEGDVLNIGDKKFIFTKKASNTGAEYINISGKTADQIAADINTKLTAAGATTKISGNTVTVEGMKALGRGLTLQIGDTSDDFNQLNVAVQNMHANDLGIGGLDIKSEVTAQQAIQKIKDAINTVSDVRGTLGATQNRLDHTINNLSVMTENIQDAESTIRDTDVAEEMMAYTKNNILIQSAQAMLAQANQVPQGVLQLLQ